MRQQGNIFQTEEQDKTPEEELRVFSSVTQLCSDTLRPHELQPPWEWVQSNDCKDDPRTQEKNGCTEQKVLSF